MRQFLSSLILDDFASFDYAIADKRRKIYKVRAFGNDYYSAANWNMSEQHMFLSEYLHSIGEKPASTSASFGLRHLLRLTKQTRKQINIHDIKARKLDHLIIAGREFCIPGDYHGLTYVDRNSAHLYVGQTIKLPWSSFLSFSDLADENDIHYQCGVFFGSVQVPPDKFGLLPARNERGGINWNKNGGVIEGLWTFNELSYAISKGAFIETCYWILKTPIAQRYLKPFADYCAVMKQNEDPRIQKIWKSAYNAGIGKLAVGEGTLLTVVPPAKREPEDAFCTVGGKLYFEREKRVSVGYNGNRLWTAMVFAQQRVDLHKALCLARNPVYAFTDSIISEGVPDLPIGTHPGEWKIVRERGTFKVKAVGVMAGDVVKHRGMSLNTLIGYANGYR